MSYPEPEPGLVISYSYLWSDEAAAGHVEGRKSRPCAIVMAVQQTEGLPPLVAVVPITHSAHPNPELAIELPRRVAAHLGLDSQPSWVVVEDVNVFRWPGYDLRPIAGTQNRYAYGYLPPKLFDDIVRRLTRLRNTGRIAATSRDEEP